MLAVIRDTRGRGVLARYDPLTLRPLSRRIIINEYHDTWSLSPNGAQLAIGLSAPGEHARIGVRIVDVSTLHVVRSIETGIAPVALAWLGPHILIAALQAGGTLMIDPETGETITRWRSFSFPDATARTRSRLVLVFGALPDAVGLGEPGTASTASERRVRLAAIVKNGLTSVTLSRIHVRRGRFDRVGLAIDPLRNRAFVVAAGAPIAEVSLSDLSVTYHATQVELNSAAAKAETLRGRERAALWLGNGKLAVFGDDLLASGTRFVARPTGVLIVDTARWSACVLDAGAARAARIGSRLLTYAGPAGAGGGASRGLRITTIGLRSDLLLAGEHVEDVTALDGHAYIRSAHGVDLVDVDIGKIVRSRLRALEVSDVVIP
jgi:hypothetical protein